MRIDGAAPSRWRATERIFSTLNRYSLKSLLQGSVVLVVLFCLLVIVYLRVSQGVAFRMVDSLINEDNVISSLCLKSTAAMIDARRLEKDFLLGYKEFGFEESRSRYITRLLAGVVEIKGNMQQIRALTGDRETAAKTREIEGSLDRYGQGVEALADKLAGRGFHDSGLHGTLEAVLRDMERQIEAAGDDTLHAKLLLVKTAEEEYVDTARDSAALAVTAASRDLAAAIAAARLTPAIGGALQKQAERYLGLFGRYVQATEEIRKLKKGYLKSVQEIDPLLEQLYVASLERVAAKRRAIERSTRLLSLPVVGIGGLVLVATALFSLTIALTVTRSVAESKVFAERIAAGDHGSRLVPVGRNEFFSMATALNTMAKSLHDAGVARQRSIDALRESEEKYRSFVETSTDWIWEIDLAGRHTFSNERVREILGIGPEELLRGDTLALLHPEDVAVVKELLERSRSTGKGWQGVVLRWHHRDGTWRWLESNAVGVTDVRGVLVGFRGVDRDVSERRKLEEELVRTQKLEAIGTLAGGIAHDFNNLLQGLFGYITLARLNLEPGDKAGEMLEQAEKAHDLSVKLTTQLLTFAKGGKPVKRRIALPALLEDAAKFALSGSRSDYRIVLEQDLWNVDADDGQLSQVMQNLVLNASEAMPRGGTVEIAASNRLVAQGDSPLLPAGGRFVRIEVRDSGAGISRENLARIFDPYFTTKQKGSGLGLATTYSIVGSHNGSIDVSSRLGEGSVFTVQLPASSGEQSPEPDAIFVGGPGAGTVLLMDDDPLVRDVAVKMIKALGYTVTATASGEEALDRHRTAREAGRPFDVVVLDLTVKRGMGGEETIRRLREVDPEIKAVVSSGYADAAVLADYRAHGFSACLHKPYRLDSLQNCLLALLQPAAAAAAREVRS